MVHVDKYGFVHCDFQPNCYAEYGTFCEECPLLKVVKKK